MSTFCDRCGYNNRVSAKFCKGCGGELENTDSIATVALQSGLKLDNRYEIKRLIKAGGMGAVYEAFDHRFDKSQCAVKEMLSISTDPEELQYFIDSFKKEGQILHRLKHLNLPTIRDYFIENGRYYLVMDYVEGEDLNTIMEREKCGISEDLVIKWAIEILDVLDYLHNQSPPIIYRDLKPPNIMLQKSTNRIMLIDFGLARTVNPGSQTVKTSIGTPAFAPPELFEGKPEPRTDIYSLGGTLHSLLTGTIPSGPYSFKPFSLLSRFSVTERTLNNLINKLSSDKLERLKEIKGTYGEGKFKNKLFEMGFNEEEVHLVLTYGEKTPLNVSKQLEAIVMRALDMNINNRYSGAKEMKRDLEKLQEEKQKGISAVTKTIPGKYSEAAIATLPPKLMSNSSDTIDNYRPSEKSVAMSDKQYDFSDKDNKIVNKFTKIVLAVIAGIIALCIGLSLIVVFIVLNFNSHKVLSNSMPETVPTISSPESKIDKNPIKPDMALIKGGTFEMGEFLNVRDKSRPAHMVKLSDFYMGKYEVTNKEYVRFLNDCGDQVENDTKWWFGDKYNCNEISHGSSGFSVNAGYENYPVAWVSWDGAVAYCNWLSEKEGLRKCYGDIGNRGIVNIIKKGYRLPTEAEWEYGCRGGTTTLCYWGDESPENYSWFDKNSDNHVHEVGKKKPNAYGLFDMNGNLWEWCSDLFGNYSSRYVINPTGPPEPLNELSQVHRVVRGGCYINGPTNSVISDLHDIRSRYDGYAVGFRLVRSK